MALNYDEKDVTRLLKNFKPEELIGDQSACQLVGKCLKNPISKMEMVVSVLEQLDPCIHLMSDDHKRLIRIIADMDWLSRGPALTKTYTAFTLNLLSAHVNHLKPFLYHIVETFKKEVKEGEPLDLNALHNLLQSICRLIPLSSMVLMPILEQQFPYHSKGVAVFESYTSHLLKVTVYIPSLRKDILDLIVKNMLKLDVRVSREALSKAVTDTDGVDEEEEEEEDDDGIFSMDLGNEDNSKSKGDDPFVKLSAVLPEAATLDAAMNVFMSYVKESCCPGGELDWAVTKKLYRELLSSFDKYILPTFLSNNTQFILFYICSFKEPVADGFIDYLWKKVTDPMTQPIFRQIAACYIGSFLARAIYIPLRTAKACMKVMMQWVHNYLDQTCDVNRQAGVEHHAAFYSVCQTCFYIFCFKHTQFVQMNKGHKWAESLNFQRVVTSQLNPLKYCSPIIVKTFSSATRMHQLAFCDTIIERNNRYSLPVTTTNALDSIASKQLYSFFPFDPYLLKKSSPFIAPLYKEFEGNAVEDDILDSEGEDDFLPDDEDIHLKSHEDKAIVDLLQYSVSPGFQHGEMSMSFK